MIGTVLTFAPGETVPRVTRYNRPMTLAEIKAHIGGGHLELVPRFDTIGYGGVIMSCVAICDEEGKLKGLPINTSATACWEQALRRQGETIIPDENEAPLDVLVGPIAVLFGDREFMKSL